MTDFTGRRAAFRNLHDGFFTIPNAATAGEAKELANLGFEAIASTSHGLALLLGKDDLSATLDETLNNLRDLVAATDLPVNADFEAGFADDAEGVAANVTRAVETGIAGLSIEDRAGDTLYPLEEAAARIRAAREAIDTIDPDVMLIGRSEGFLLGSTDLAATIERLQAYAEAGADVLYAPAVTKPDDIAAIVAAVAPKPVNVLLVSPEMNAGNLQKLGVRRVSTGGFLAMPARAAFMSAATELQQSGSLPAACFG